MNKLVRGSAIIAIKERMRQDRKQNEIKAINISYDLNSTSIKFFETLHEQVKIASDKIKLNQTTCISPKKIWNLFLLITFNKKTKIKRKLEITFKLFKNN